MNWFDVLPEHLAREQVAFERRNAILRAWRSGAKQKDIAKALGCTPGNVSRLINTGEWRERHGNTAPPIVQDCDKWLSDMIPGLELAAAQKHRREKHWSHKPTPRQHFEPWP